MSSGIRRRSRSTASDHRPVASDRPERGHVLHCDDISAPQVQHVSVARHHDRPVVERLTEQQIHPLPQLADLERSGVSGNGCPDFQRQRRLTGAEEHLPIPTQPVARVLDHFAGHGTGHGVSPQKSCVITNHFVIEKRTHQSFRRARVPLNSPVNKLRPNPHEKVGYHRCLCD